MIGRGDQEARGHPGGDRLEVARRLILTHLGAEVAVLAVSGVALFFAYRPSVSQAWSDVVASDVAARVLVLRSRRWAAGALCSSGVRR